MTDPTRQLSRSHDIASKVAQVFQTRAKLAQEHLSDRVEKICSENVTGLTAQPATPWEFRSGGIRYIETLPMLLSERADRDRLLTLLDRLLADQRIQRVKPSSERLAMLERIRTVLASSAARRARVVAAK